MARILLYTLVFPPDNVSNAFILADLARELVGYGHEVRVLTTTPHYNVLADTLAKQQMTPLYGNWLLRSEIDGVVCYHIQVPAEKGGILRRMKTAFRFHFLGLWAMWKVNWQYELVISQSPPLSAGLIGAWLARMKRAKCTYIVQDIFPDGVIREGRLRNPFIIKALKLLERWVYRSNNAVSVISEGFAETLRPRIPPRTQLTVIPNFVDTALYQPLPRQNDHATKWGLTDRFVVSYVGNIGIAQDFGPLFAAAKGCADLPIKFIMVGGGIHKDQLQKRAADEGLSNLEFWGYVPREVTPWINACSDLTLVLLAGHVRSDGFPSKIYTLMASGRPILLVGDPDSDIARFLTEAQAGWVVACGDEESFVRKIRQLYTSRQQLDARGSNGVKVVGERFTVSAVARQYDELIQRLVGPSKASDGKHA